MSLGTYLHALRRRAWIVVLTTLLGAAAGFGLTAGHKATYAAASQLYITVAPGVPASDASGTSTMLQNQMVAYSTLAKSPLVLDPTIKKLGLSTTSLDLAKEIDAEAPAETTLLTIGVTDANAQRAADIANTIADQMVGRVADMSPMASTGGKKVFQAYITQPAAAPDHAAGRSRMMTIAALTAAGLLLGAVLAVLLEVLAGRRHRRELHGSAEAATDAAPRGSHESGARSASRAR